MIENLTQMFIEVIESSRPDKIKENYNRVMIEAGLMKSNYKPIWLPKRMNDERYKCGFCLNQNNQ